MDELANALTHGIGLILALVAVPVLIVLAATQGTDESVEPPIL